jgi:hypothetical protein
MVPFFLIIQRRDVYGAWEQYLGLEHTDTTSKRSYTANQVGTANSEPWTPIHGYVHNFICIFPLSLSSCQELLARDFFICFTCTHIF